MREFKSTGPLSGEGIRNNGGIHSRVLSESLPCYCLVLCESGQSMCQCMHGTGDLRAGRVAYHTEKVIGT